jgi:hypothetical protein
MPGNCFFIQVIEWRCQTHLVLTHTHMIVEIYVFAGVVLQGRGNVYVNITLKHVRVTVVAVEEQ